MELGQRLRMLRKRCGKSIYELSKISGLDPGFIGRIEQGARGASRETVLRLGLALVHASNAITLHDIDELLLDAGFAPLVRAS